ncbi:hypothetical protein AgCh_025697 [Apium graveolens]
MKQWWKTAMVEVLAVVMVIERVISDPQANLLSQECSQYEYYTYNTFELYSNLNATLAQLRRQISVGKAHFATAKLARTTNPVHSMVQCRNSLPTADCVACFDVAALDILKSCSLAYGARVIYDGCFLRYELHSFYWEIDSGSSFEVCGENKSGSAEAAFSLVTVQLLKDLAAATPKIKSYFAVGKRQVFDGGLSKKASAEVYGLAQCVDTVSQSGCKNCLTRACTSTQKCLPQLGGSFVAAGCFLRYSVTSFFAENDRTNIMPVVQQADILGLTELRGPTPYSYKDLKSATKNFSEKCKIGEGGFGDIYKGITANGNVVAVKKLAVTTRIGKTDIESEVRLVCNVHHRNIIRLLGFSGKGPVKLLVYEYMKNGSLDTFLYGNKRGTLSWKQRIDIILGIARGLAYLYEQFHECIIHRDIKSSNILLDDDFQPKIADFGLARLLPINRSHLTTGSAGTLGYTAPEYAIHGHLSEKVDTYGFGIVVLEIISGQSCTRMKNELLIESLVAYAWKSYNNGTHMKLIDETLNPREYNV